LIIFLVYRVTVEHGIVLREYICTLTVVSSHIHVPMISCYKWTRLVALCFVILCILYLFSLGCSEFGYHFQCSQCLARLISKV